MMNIWKSIAVALALIAMPQAAMAYIGPGAGLTAIGSVLAFLGVIVLLIAGFLWYPVKRFLKRRRAGADDAGTPDP